MIILTHSATVADAAALSSRTHWQCHCQCGVNSISCATKIYFQSCAALK